jgi:hypothetical protein
MSSLSVEVEVPLTFLLGLALNYDPLFGICLQSSWSYRPVPLYPALSIVLLCVFLFYFFLTFKIERHGKDFENKV